jgi:hypothetical protein
MNPEMSICKAVCNEFGQEMTRKDFDLSASERVSRLFEQNLSIAILGFFNFNLDLYKTLGAFGREYSLMPLNLALTSMIGLLEITLISYLVAKWGIVSLSIIRVNA